VARELALVITSSRFSSARRYASGPSEDSLRGVPLPRRMPSPLPWTAVSTSPCSVYSR
jgi:hypothetical protein